MWSFHKILIATGPIFNFRQNISEVRIGLMSPLTNYKKQKRYYFKQENTYFGIIYCMGTPLILSTSLEDQAIFHYEEEVDQVIKILTKNKIFADPIEINFYGNYKPSRDNICNPEV